MINTMDGTERIGLTRILLEKRRANIKDANTEDCSMRSK